MTKRLDPSDRLPAILHAATILSRKHGYTKVSRDAIAKQADCSPGLVSYHFKTLAKLRRAVMGEALRARDLVIIGQGLAARDSRAMRAPDELRRAAVESMMLQG